MTYYSALHYAAKAEKSATSAANSAAQASQVSGKIIQLGFDGTLEGNLLTFKHAPSGVEIPYSLLDDYEYELDLAYNGDLDSLTTMVVKNGSDTISFVSALHRSSTEPARVADMDAVMRYDATTGYRWLFKATFKIAPNGAKVFLLYPVVAAKDYSDKTNCITEIPQDIKLELNNGVLTLKAGSKVYVPNGANKFDEVVISTDKTSTANFTNRQAIVFYNGSNIVFDYITSVGSGIEFPTGAITGFKFYNTTNNKIYRYNGTSWDENNYSLPIAIVTFGDTAGIITSIDQVFNGFGYIGSTAFALPGVKGLIPDGRNADGSLKNIEFTVDKVVTKTITWNNVAGQELFIGKYNLNESIHFISTGKIGQYYIQEDEPTKVQYAAWYKPTENKVYRCDKDSNGNLIWKDNFPCYIGQWFTSGTSPYPIIKLTTKLPFRAVDYNDFIQNTQELKDSLSIEISYEG